MNMYNKEEITQQIWLNPDAATGLHFVRKGRKWISCQRMNGENTSRTDRLQLEQNGTNGQVFYYYHGDGERKPFGDIWELLQYRYGTNDFTEVLERAATAYGIQPTFQNAEAQKAWKQRTTTANIATEAAGILTNALHTDAGTATRLYLQGRGLEPSTRMGAFSAALRQELTDKLQKKYDAEDVKAAIASLFPVWRVDKEGKWHDFADAYGLIIPYYSGCRLFGFCLRCTAAEQPTYTDEKGAQQTMPKYLFSRSKDKGGIMEKGGYCPVDLESNKPVFLVEGLLDAEAVMQCGVNNVMALGGMTITDREDKANSSQIKTLQRFGVRDIVYMPDVEHEADGTLKTGATERTIKALQPYLTGTINNENGFVSLCIIKHTLQDVKDAADILKVYGKETLCEVLYNTRVDWWAWLATLNLQQNADNLPDMADNFARLYMSVKNPIERELIRQQITAAPAGTPLHVMKEAGITASSLLQIERTGELNTYRTRITDAIDALKDAADKHAPADTMRRLIDNAAQIQNHSTALTFAAQINATTDMLGAQIANEGEYIDTCWTLWKENGGGTFEPVRLISFAPASISVFAAPTSHGKTLVMLQTALYLAQHRQEHVLYVGLENDAKQLFIRALCAYIGDAWKGLKIPNKRRAIRRYFKGQRIVADEGQQTFETAQTDKAVNELIRDKVAEYEDIVRPFLHLVRVGNDCEAMCDMIRQQVEQWQDNGEPIAAVFIDYCQLLHLTGRNYSRTDEMKNICDNLNELAKTTGLPVIVGSQMNRASTKGEGGTMPPLDNVDLGNLGESSGIENIAEDCYLIWDIDRTNTNRYEKNGIIMSRNDMLHRSRRIFEDTDAGTIRREGNIYIESMKAREYATGCYCIIPADFAAGTLDTKNVTKH